MKLTIQLKKLKKIQKSQRLMPQHSLKKNQRKNIKMTHKMKMMASSHAKNSSKT